VFKTDRKKLRALLAEDGAAGDDAGAAGEGPAKATTPAS
jgi:hypothetical protein